MLKPYVKQKIGMTVEKATFSGFKVRSVRPGAVEIPSLGWGRYHVTDNVCSVTQLRMRSKHGF